MLVGISVYRGAFTIWIHGAAMAGRSLVVLTGVFFQICSVFAGKILMSAGVDQTHYIFSAKIGRELVRRGHQVTFLLSSSYIHRLNGSDADWFEFQVYNSPYTPQDVVKMRDAFALESLNSTYQSQEGYAKLLIGKLLGWKSEEDKQEELKPTKPMSKYLSFECNVLLSDEELMERLKGSQFDLMTLDFINPCMALVAQKLSLRFVIITAASLTPGLHDRWYDIPTNPAYVPLCMSGYSDSMTFWQRFRNAVTWLAMSVFMDRPMLGPYDALKIRHNIRTDLNMRDTIRSAELWLANTHFAMEYSRAITPNAIMLGGLSAEEPQPLSKELEEFFEGSGKHGVVVFSLGSVVDVMSEEMADTIAGALSRLPQRVLWRYPGKPPKSLGGNTKLVSWLSQNDVLGHPKTRLLIYHGGINGMLEAMYHGVPVVTIPLFGEHFECAARLQTRGMAETVNLPELSEDKLHQTAVRVLNNESYAANAKRISGIMKHNVAPPVEVAGHWVEHAMLHGGAYLRSTAGTLTTVQYYMLDVIYVGVGITIFTFAATVWAYWMLCCKAQESGDKVKTS
ncbi:UDP-glucuronosyltransferase 2C1-like [Patiria miniata]|uniref:UDP-glycosyltransferases domain-containing protein n=1 Tax=Patiria miniata TaxID=46514 RepID=A0A914B2H7_PATMI|nr:UDP-glucuronosyltransferase 2C1-like [Patiria miniata]